MSDDTGARPARAEPAVSGKERSELLRSVLVFAGVAVLVAAVGTCGFSWLIAHAWPWQYPEKTPHVVDVVKLAFAVVAGIGGVVALVVAYRRQRILERDEAGQRDRTRLLTERFGAAAAQLGDDAAAVRLAGVYAMAAVADEWDEQRQQCVDVLCAYLRLPYTGEPDPGTPTTTVRERPWPRGKSAGRETLTYAAARPGESEVRNTIVRVIAEHLAEHATVSWSPCRLDFAGVRFDIASFDRSIFGCPPNFERATFKSDAGFDGATFEAGARFFGATFKGFAMFSEATFEGYANFGVATFKGHVGFDDARFGSYAGFAGATFEMYAAFGGATFESGAGFREATFESVAGFRQAAFGDAAAFEGATFKRYAGFREAAFKRAAEFSGATFEGPADFGRVTFDGDQDFMTAVFREGRPLVLLPRYS